MAELPNAGWFRSAGRFAGGRLFDVDYANLFGEKSNQRATGSFDLNGYNSNSDRLLDRRERNHQNY